MEHVEEVFINLAEQFEDCEDIIDSLRSLETCNEITEEEYDYIIKNWDNILKKYDL